MRLEVTGVGPLLMRRIAPDGAGAVLPGPEGLTIRYDGLIESRGSDIPSVAEFAIFLVGTVSATLIATGLTGWIRDTFGERPTMKVTINRHEIDSDDAGQVRRIVEEEIRAEPALTSMDAEGDDGQVFGG